MSAKAESAARPSAADPRILFECVRTLYLQIPNSFVAAVVVSTYMVVTTWKQVPLDRVLFWLALQTIAQMHRFWIYFSYRKATLDTDNARLWARRYAWYMAFAGFVWGSTAFLFFSVESPLTLALTMCGLYGISGGAVPGNAYFPPAIYAFTWIIFGMVMLKLSMIGDVGHVALGVASVFYAMILTMFCRVQYRTLVEGFLIRFENAELVAKLQLQKQYAEEAQLRAEQANLAKSQFLAAASHDLRQPLHALSLFSASLQELRLDRAARDIVERILSSIGALESLFNALLDVSKLDAGVIKPAPITVPVQQLFDRVQQYSEGEAANKKIALTFVKTRRVVLADPNLLERILSNLVSNAIRYTPQGRVLVGCRRAGAQHLRFEVWDTGVGIAANDHARIFEEFVQIGNPERDRRKGLGLGLAIAQRTAALMETRVELDSVPGKGSVFRFELALSHEPLLAASVKTSLANNLMAGLRVLVIDDEEAIRDGFALLLRGWGMQVCVAADLAQALQLMDQGARYDVVLADYRLRDHQNGIDAIRVISSRHSVPPLACLITGDTDPELLQRAREQNLMLLQKPVQPAQLRALLNHLRATQRSVLPAA